MKEKNFFTNFLNKRILVTGGCGTIGREVIRQLLEDYSIGELIAIDNNESELFFLPSLTTPFALLTFYSMLESSLT